MKLSAVNYNNDQTSKLKTVLDKEDEAILRKAETIITEKNLGKGGLIISEVLHTDLVNLNHRSYNKKGMSESINSFHTPYYTPFLMHHETGGGGMFGGGDPNLIAVGVSVWAEYIKRTTDTVNGIASGYVKVATHIAHDSMVGNTNTLSAIQSRRLMALSIGASVSDKNYTCSVCNQPRRSGDCDHELGETYKGKLCYAEVANPVFKEYSAVYSPSDIIAAIRKLYVSEANGGVEERHEIDQSMGLWTMGLYEVSGTKQYPSAPIPSVHETETGTGVTEEEVKPEAIKKLNDLLTTITAKVTEKEKTIEEQSELIANLAGQLNDALSKIAQYESGKTGEGDPASTEESTPSEPETAQVTTETELEPAASTEPVSTNTQTQEESNPPAPEGSNIPVTEETPPAGDPAPEEGTNNSGTPPPEPEKPVPESNITGESTGPKVNLSDAFSFSSKLKKNSTGNTGHKGSRSPFGGISRIR